MLAAVAEFERDLIRERVVAGIRRAQAKGVRLGRRTKYDLDGEEVERLFRAGRSLSSIARELGAGAGRPQTILVTRVLRKRGCL
jgi:DNA invertase Pin-like site-specific DNA recombinase